MAGIPSRFPEAYCAGQTRIPRRPDFAIARPAGLSAWTLLATTAGTGRIALGERPACRRGDLVLIPPGIRHQYGRDPAAARWVHLWLVFEARLAWLPLLAWPGLPGAPGYRRLAAAGPAGAAIFAALRAAYAERRESGPSAAPLLANLIEQVLLRCHRLHQQTVRDEADPRLAAAIAWMEARLALPLRVAGIARSVGMSESRFAHAFRRHLGLSPGRWLEQRRLALARERLLGSNEPIAAIAAACGYPDPDWFAAVFRRATGRTPMAFRAGTGRRPP